MRSGRWRRVLAGPLLAATACLAGCVSMPSGGPVTSVPVTQGPNAQSQPYVQIVAGPPQKGWTPTQIVEGFLTASASFGDNGQVTRQYMTQQAYAAWKPSWTAIVYKTVPTVSSPVYSSPATTSGSKNNSAKTKQKPAKTLATVTISGTIQANLCSSGTYAVASAAEPPCMPGGQPTFQLEKVGGEWRISSVPQELLLTSDSFANDYQLRNLYFFNPQTSNTRVASFLVPDPVYVPLRATAATLMDGLVRDLINPPNDWLSNGATRTAFPSGTTLIGDVTLDGVTAVVNLGGAIVHAKPQVLSEVSAQLLQTLSGAGQGGQSVHAIEVLLNGKPWIPPNSQGNPVQAKSDYSAPDGASQTFYYLDAAGSVVSQNGTHGKPVQIAKLGTQYQQIAVSPDGKYLAALTNSGSLYTGPLRGPLSERSGTGYVAMSWDQSDELWATTGDNVMMLRADATGQQAQPLPVVVKGFPFSVTDVGAVQVAPDGVRVALIIGGNLYIGAISAQPGGIMVISLSPFYVSSSSAAFDSVSWYGPDNVITLSGPGTPTPAVTEYPVNGGTATAIPAEADMESLTTSSGYDLIAALPNGHLVADASLTGTWTNFGTGSIPAYPG